MADLLILPVLVPLLGGLLATALPVRSALVGTLAALATSLSGLSITLLV